MSSIHNPEQLM